MKRILALCLCCYTVFPTIARAAWGDWPTWGDQRDGTYRNPILPGDYSDIDCIRVGDDFYAISSTFQYSPGMVILKSKDLVNWTIAGHAVTNITEISPELNWDRMNRAGRGIWAGAIRHHAGKFRVYFGTPEEGYFMTTAKDVAGPWEPLTHLKKSGGWDDCCPFWDDDGQGYFIGTQFEKDPVNGKKYNIHLWKMTPDGKSLIPESDDEFSTSSLPPQWEWHYHPRADKWSLTERPGFLRLHAFKPLSGDNLVKVGNILTQRTMRVSSNVVTTRMELTGMADGQRAGFYHLGAGSQAAVGVIQEHGKRNVFFSTGSKLTPTFEIKEAAIWLRTSWGLDGMADFSISSDGRSFQPAGEKFRMTWSAYRGSRIGLFSYNPEREAGHADFDGFHHAYSGQAAPSKNPHPSE